MNVDDSLLEQLPREECLRLMGSVLVGRMVYTRQALPPGLRHRGDPPA